MFEGGRRIGTTLSEKVMVAAGRHEIEFVNQTLAYRAVRSVVVPEGSHKIEMKFNPESYEQGMAVSQAAWGVTILLTLAGLYPMMRKRFGGRGAEEPPAAGVA